MLTFLIYTQQQLQTGIITGYNFGEEEPTENGGSENPQNPFSMDEPDDWFTSNGAHIPIENRENQNEAFNDHIEKCHKYDKIDIDKIPPVKVDKQEYAKVIQSFDTYLPLEEKKQGGVFVKDVFPNRYTVYFKGNKFKILERE